VGKQRLICRSISWEIEYQTDPERMPTDPKATGHMIFLWHEHSLMMVYNRKYHWKERKNIIAMILASGHRDGRLISETAKSFGYVNTSGSSSQNGHAAVMKLEQALRDGLDVGITPDGPRGPRRKLKDGGFS
jgi:lysophospholipid acyltransferase (LPLAT)-like uncharacterized protein